MQVLGVLYASELENGLTDRATLDSHFIWDVLLEGYSDNQIQQWYRKHGKAPKPNSVRAHNEKVTWSAVSPQLGSADMAEHVRVLKTYIMGGFRYPNHWYASGGLPVAATDSVQQPVRLPPRGSGSLPPPEHRPGPKLHTWPGRSPDFRL